ncbi:hypothetical protein IQ264_07565 [Phormidium sp. LEGE 05292]|uniref:hypothetical protein n=1 Tax=[Phormidium] sp. LEGE 05292 TaxID=767427 RepID=UPI00187E633A|nr:hypothetical protein [Phormidium sp. LEGE 05292]MBE9225289.1 hypothetical protein [Phormidium sp. LEGE 05292]
MDSHLYELTLEQISLLLEPINAASTRSVSRRKLFELIGWDLGAIPNFPTDQFNEKLNEWAKSYQKLENSLENIPETLIKLLEDLKNADSIIKGIQNLKELLNLPVPQIEDLGNDLLNYLIVNYLETRQPSLYYLAVLANAIQPQQKFSAVVDAGAIVRFPHTRPVLNREFIQTITEFLKNPVGILKHLYLGDSGHLITQAQAEQAANQLFPVLGRLLETFGIQTIYGLKLKEDDELDFGEFGNQIGRGMLTFRVASGRERTSWGATLALSPEELGDLGLVVVPFGDLKTAQVLGDWQITCELTEGVRAFAIGPQGATWLAQPGTTVNEVRGKLIATKFVETQDLAILVGSQDSSHFHAKTLKITADTNLSSTQQKYGIEIAIDAVKLVLDRVLSVAWKEGILHFGNDKCYFLFKELNLGVPQLLDNAIAGNLQLTFENGELKTDESYFERYETDTSSPSRLNFNRVHLDRHCLAIQWQESNINYWLKQIVPNLFNRSPQSNIQPTVRFLFGNFSKPLQEIRLDWKAGGQSFILPGLTVTVPEGGFFSLVLGAGDFSLTHATLILTLPANAKFIASSNFAWERESERELQNDKNAKALFNLTLTPNKNVSIVLVDLDVEQNLERPKLPKFFSSQLNEAIAELDFANIEQLHRAVEISGTSLKAEDWVVNFNFDFDNFTFPFLQQEGDLEQFISIGKPTLINQERFFTEKRISLELPVTIKIGSIQLPTQMNVELNLETFALDVEHEKGIYLISTKPELKGADEPNVSPEHLGLTWKFQGVKLENEDKYHFFTLITKNYNYQIRQAPGAQIEVQYRQISEEPITFTVSDFVLSEKGINLIAEVTEQPVSLNGLETKFRFRNSRLEIKENQIRDLTLCGSGPLPPALVGTANADIALQLAQRDRALTLVAGTAQLKGTKLLSCKDTRFQFSIDAIGLKFVNDGKFHLYFTLTGSAQFTPLPGDDPNSPLALLKLIRIDLVECPLTGNVRVISKHIKFLIELPSPKSFNFLGCFEMELQGIGFLPQAEVFNGLGAMHLTGQLKFAQGPGDSANSDVEYHTLLIGLPKPGDFAPRIYFDKLPVNLNMGSAFRLDGVVSFIDKEQEKGFDGEGRLEIQGLPPIAASFSFLRVRKDEFSPWLRAWFIYLEVQKVSFHIPVVEMYLREVGLGFGYRFTIASIKAADRTKDLRKLIGELRALSRTQGDLSKRDRWAVDLEESGESPRWTIVLRALIAQLSAATSPLEYNAQKEKELACVYLFDAVIAFRSDLTFFMAVRGWLNTNYDYYYNNKNIHSKPLFSGFALLSPRQKRFLAQLSSNPEGFTGANPPLPEFIESAIKNSQFSATLLVEPGLVHYELGWPNMLRWSDSFGPLKVEYRGGFIFRVSKKEMVIGISLLARASLRLKAEAELGIVGARVEAAIDVAYGGRFIGVIDFAKPKENSAFYAAIGLELQIRLKVEFWIKLRIRILRFRKTIKKSYSLTAKIGFTGGLELGLNGLYPDKAGLRGSGTLSFSAMGHSIQLNVKFGFKEDNVENALNRTKKYLQMGLEATDVEPVPGLAGEGSVAERSLRSSARNPVTPVMPLAASSTGDTDILPADGDGSTTEISTTQPAPENPTDPKPIDEISFPTDPKPKESTITENVEELKVPNYLAFVISKPELQKGYFLLIPKGEPEPNDAKNSSHERGFLPVPPALINPNPDPEQEELNGDRIEVENDFTLTLPTAIDGLMQFQPYSTEQNQQGGWVSLTGQTQFSWKANWGNKIGEGDVYELNQNSKTYQETNQNPETVYLGDYLSYAFKKEIGENKQEKLIDPEPLPAKTSLEDGRVYNPSDNAYEAAVRGAVEQFQGSPFFKRDPKSEYDQILGKAFDSETTIYSSSGSLLNEQSEEVQANQQALQFRSMIIQDLIADFRTYVELVERRAEAKQQAEILAIDEDIKELEQKAIAFQMGLVFQFQCKLAENGNTPADWLNRNNAVNPKLQQRSSAEQLQPDESKEVIVRTFNTSDINFKQKPPQFKRVQHFTDANTIAITWDLVWENFTSIPEMQSQSDPNHHLMHYRVRRTVLDISDRSGDREIAYTVKPCEVLHREAGQLKSLKPRFQIVDHFNQETLEDQAALPVTGRRYRYEITPIDFAGNPSREPLVLFATRYPNEPPQVPTDAELIVHYLFDRTTLSTAEAAGRGLPTVLEPQLSTDPDTPLYLEWTEPKPVQQGPQVPVARYWLIFRRDSTLPIGSYGLDQVTQESRIKLLPTSNARRLPTDITISIERDQIELRSESDTRKPGRRVKISLNDLKQAGIFPNREWRSESWRVFLQTEAASPIPNNNQNQVISSSNGVLSALAPVRLLLRIQATESDDNLKEERRPASLEWLPKPLKFSILPPEDLCDERGESKDTARVDATRIAHFPMPKLNDSGDISRVPKFDGTLDNIVYQPHPADIRCIRLRWNQGPSHLLNYPLELNAGYEIFQLDIDAYPRSTFENPEKLAKALRKIQEIQLIPGEDTNLTPSDTLTTNQWEAWYPSTMLRHQAKRPEGSDSKLPAPWYSWRESLLEWPEWLIPDSGRPSALHPCLQKIIDILDEKYIVDLQTSPPIQPSDFAEFLNSTPTKSDPYGWGILQRFGLSATFCLRYDLPDEKRSDRLPGELVPSSQLLAELNQILQTSSEETLNLGQSERKLKDFYQHFHIELLFQPGRRTSLKEETPSVDALLAIVQISLRPVPKQVLQYSRFSIIGSPGASIDLILNLKSEPCSLIDQSEPASGQVELKPSTEAIKPSTEPIRRRIKLPLNGQTTILLRSKDLPKIGILLQEEFPQSSEDLKKIYSYEAEPSNTKQIVLEIQQENLKPEERQQLSQTLNNILATLLSEKDKSIAEFKFEVPYIFSATNELSTYFSTSSDSLGKIFTTDANYLQQWEQFQKYTKSLNSRNDKDPQIVDTKMNEQIADFLTWSQRFFDHSGDMEVIDGIGKAAIGPWLVTAYPRSGSPAYATPDKLGRLTYDRLIEDRWAHNYRYYIKPYGRYDLLLQSLRESLFPKLPNQTIEQKPIPVEIDPQAGGLDIVLNRTQPVAKPLVLASRRLDEVPVPALSGSSPNVVPAIPGKIWEVIIAQHPEQTLIERNQTLARQLGFRQIAFTLLRRFAYPDWFEQLKKAVPQMPTSFTLPTNAQIPDIPSEIVRDAETKDEPGNLSLDLPNRIGDFQQGAMVVQWEALPFYYEHCLLLVAQSTSTVSPINATIQRDFEYRCPEPKGVERTEFEFKAGETEKSCNIQIRLRNLWDSLPKEAQIRWLMERPENRPDRESNNSPIGLDGTEARFKLSSLPDLEVVYQIVEWFSSNIEVQAEIFFDRTLHNYAVRQLGQRIKVQLMESGNYISPPKIPQEDYILKVKATLDRENSDMRGRELLIRTRRGSAEPSSLKAFELTQLGGDAQ